MRSFTTRPMPGRCLPNGGSVIYPASFHERLRALGIGTRSPFLDGDAPATNRTSPPYQDRGARDAARAFALGHEEDVHFYETTLGIVLGHAFALLLVFLFSFLFWTGGRPW